MENILNTDAVMSLGSIGTDVIVILGVIVLLVALGFTKGKSELIALLVAVFPAALLTQFFPFMGILTFGNPGLDRALVFGSFLIVIMLLLRPYIAGSYPKTSFWRSVEIVALSIACTGAIAAVLIQVCDIAQVYPLSGLILGAFMGPVGVFWWLVGGLAAIPLFVRA